MQNGLALAGDYMSASTLLGITAIIYTDGIDGYIYLIAFFTGWPVLLLLMTDRLRNLGKFTFADVTSYRLAQRPIRAMSALGSLVVVCFYLIAQMVGAGQLIKLLFGLEYNWALIIVGFLMMAYVIFGGMVATTWVQITKAFLLLIGGTIVALLAFSKFDFDFETLVSRPWRFTEWGSVADAGQASGRSRRRDFVEPWSHIRHGGDASYPDAILHGEGCKGS